MPKQPPPDTFLFDLGDRVTIATSGEAGKVIGRAEYDFAEPGYLVRYAGGDGRAAEQWWTEGALARPDTHAIKAA